METVSGMCHGCRVAVWSISAALSSCSANIGRAFSVVRTRAADASAALLAGTEPSAESGGTSEAP